MNQNLETTYRVFYLEPELNEQWRKVRDADEWITRDWVHAAVEKNLPTIAKQLKELGLAAPDERVPVRLEMPLESLQALADVAEASGIPAQQLLAMCLGRASATKPKRRRAAKK